MSWGVQHLQGLTRFQLKHCICFPSKNRNKKSIAVDVTNPKGQEVVYRLVQKCDVFLQNFRSVIRDRARLDYATLSRYNPKLIYCNISALGPDGPDNGGVVMILSGRPVLDLWLANEQFSDNLDMQVG